MLLLFTPASTGLLARIIDTPVSRHPPNAALWIQARIEGNATTADAESGEWVVVQEDFALEPAGTDPASPRTYTFTVVVDDTDLRWFRIVWIDDTNLEYPTAAEDRDALADPAIIPTVKDVGNLLHARTTVGGTEVGTFTDDTAVTEEQVTGLIVLAVKDVQARVGTTIPPKYMAESRRLAALQAASMVEASFFANQLDSDRSAYRQYQAMYLTGVENLAVQVNRPAALRLV